MLLKQVYGLRMTETSWKFSKLLTFSETINFFYKEQSNMGKIILFVSVEKEY